MKKISEMLELNFKEQQSNENQRIRALGPLKIDSARSGDHFALVKTEFDGFELKVD